MPATYRIRFTDSETETDWFGSRGFYYEFADGTTIGLDPTIAWCCHCEAFIDAESIPSLEHVEDELRKRSDPDLARAEMVPLGLPMDESPTPAQRRGTRTPSPGRMYNAQRLIPNSVFRSANSKQRFVQIRLNQDNTSRPIVRKYARDVLGWVVDGND